MSDATNGIVLKLWSYCHVLRDDGLSYQHYLEHLTFLLLKNGRRARAAHRRGAADPRRIPLGRPRRAADGGYRARAALPRDAARARPARRDARPDLREGAFLLAAHEYVRDHS